MAGLTPTQRTLRALRGQGRLCEVVERYIPQAGPHGIRRDLFNIIDIIALDPVRGVVGIQSCGQSFAEHERTILEARTQETIEWLSTPGTKLELWGWRKVKLKRGGAAMRWQPRIREFTLADFGVEYPVTDEQGRGTHESEADQPDDRDGDARGDARGLEVGRDDRVAPMGEGGVVLEAPPSEPSG